jgi:hypothetical protein
MRPILVFLAAAVVLAGQDPRELILRSAAFEARDLELIRNYTFLRHEEKRSLNSSGQAAKTEQRTVEVLMLYGRPYERLVAEDGRALPPDKERKEQQKLDKEMQRRGGESQEKREKRAAGDKKELEEARQFRLEVADAFNFTLLGEEVIDGHKAWMIQAEPKHGFRPRSKDGKILPKVRGKLWVSQQDYRWVRLEAEVIDTFSLGFGMLRLNPGTNLQFEARKINGELWMPHHAYVRGNGRLALLKKLNLEMEARWDNYRKFQTESRIVSSSEPQ